MTNGFQAEALTGADRKWLEKADQLEVSALPDLRASAEKWAGALIAGLGAVGFAGLLEGPEPFASLTGKHKDYATYTFLGAAVVATVAIALATLAAHGTVKSIQSHSGAAYREWAQKQVTTWGRALKWSRWLAALAVVLLAISTSYVWFGDQKADTPVVIDASGTALCPSSGTSPEPVSGASYRVRCAP